MDSYLMEEAKELIQKPSPERQKVFLKKIDAVIEAYDKISKDLARQARTYDAKIQELCLLKEMLDLNERKAHATSE